MTLDMYSALVVVVLRTLVYHAQPIKLVELLVQAVRWAMLSISITLHMKWVINSVLSIPSMLPLDPVAETEQLLQPMSQVVE